MILQILRKATLFVTLSLILATLQAADLPHQHPIANPKDTLAIKKVEIVRYTKKTEGKNAKGCPSWNLTKQQITEAIQESRFIDGHEFQYFFSVLSCRYEGEVIVNDTLQFKFEVNAGSYIILYKKEITLFMGYDKKSIPFLSTPGIE